MTTDPPTLLPASVRDLEALFRRRRHVVERLVSLDAYDRWGAHTDADRDWCMGEQYRFSDICRDLEQRLDTAAASLRDSDTAAFQGWVAAHLRLLDHLIETGDADSTEVFVAREERTAWLEVHSTERAWVDENPHYIKHEGTRYTALFGASPDEGKADLGPFR